MALMLRYEGIPARVAVGFAGPTFDSGKDAWKFTDHDAHAWVEVWFKGYGWLEFDPTPATPGSSRGHLIAAFAGPSTRDRSGGSVANRNTGGPKPTGAGSRRVQLGRGSRNTSGGGPVPTPGSGGFPYALTFLLLVLGVVALIALAKETRRRVHRLARDPRLIAAACRDELASFLLDQGIDSPASATVRDLAVLAQRHLGVDDVDRFVDATTAARFGRPEAAAAAARDARRESGPLLESCRRFLTRRERLRGLLSVRSLSRARWTVDGSASLGSTPS